MKYILLSLVASPLTAFALCTSPMSTGNARLDQQSQSMYMSCFENERKMKAQQEQMEQQQRQQALQQQYLRQEMESQQRRQRQQMQEQQEQLENMQRRMNGGK